MVGKNNRREGLPRPELRKPRSHIANHSRQGFRPAVRVKISTADVGKEASSLGGEEALDDLV